MVHVFRRRDQQQHKIALHVTASNAKFDSGSSISYHHEFVQLIRRLSFASPQQTNHRAPKYIQEPSISPKANVTAIHADGIEAEFALA